LEKAFLLYVAARARLSDSDDVTLRAALQVSSLTRLSDVEAQFSPPIEEFTDRAEPILKRVVLHFQIVQTLTHLQGPVDWPRDPPVPDVLLCYAVLLGAHRNGTANLDRILRNIECTISRTLPAQTIWKILHSLTTFFCDSVTGPHLGVEFLEPFDWREQHSELFGRASLSEDEFRGLFRVVAYLGFPGAVDIDFAAIATFANLGAVSPAVLRADCTLLHALATETLDPRAEAALLERLGPCGTRVWVTRLRRNYEDLTHIRMFCTNLTQRTQALIARTPRWDAAPQWWDADYDLALIQALADYGLLFFLVWLVDQNRPFLARVPAMSVIEFSTLAEMEHERARAQRPSDLGELAFLGHEKARIARALAVIEAVNAEVAPPPKGDVAKRAMDEAARTIQRKRAKDESDDGEPPKQRRESRSHHKRARDDSDDGESPKHRR
jgi:hypothetical protein